MRGRGAVAGIAALLALTALKLWWCGCFELSPDEAYYWLWSQHLDWAYYSKGPGIALAIRFATWVLGDTERGVRWLSPVLALGTTGLLWLLVRDTLSRATATASALVLQVVPLFTVGSLLMTIDPLSIFFWVLALLLGWRALRAPGSAAWALCGAACGLGFLCKYTNALVLVGILLAARGVLRTPLIAGFLPFTLPPLLWNASHGWPTARHLFERGGLAREGPWLQPQETLEFVAVHFGTWSPILFAMLLLALPSMLRRRSEDGPRYLMMTAAPVLATYAALALHEAGEANWTAPGMIGLLPLAVDHWKTRARWVGGSGIVMAAVLSMLIANTDLLRMAGINLPARMDPSTRLRGWRETSEKVALSRDDRDVVASHYGLASELAFYGGIDAGVPRTDRPRNQFWFWERTESERVLFVSDRDAPPDDPSLRCVPDGARQCTTPLRTIRAYSCLRMPPEPPR